MPHEEELRGRIEKLEEELRSERERGDRSETKIQDLEEQIERLRRDLELERGA